eukprot:TRINITY_DN1951_c0_g1_i1.p1 TRINITY_DN1951_c0_g1~~TRINITY_DN1951_c0_g1_i1.p1  ORF type:complete len:350 (+),score=43.35 TRINITY_DN1951_c0_g1_i1:228-1277(+)
MVAMATRSTLLLPQALAICSTSGPSSQSGNVACQARTWTPLHPLALSALRSTSCVQSRRCSPLSSRRIEGSASRVRRFRCSAISTWDSGPLGLDTDHSLREAAIQMVDLFVKPGMVVGLGSGHVSQLAIEYIGMQLARKTLQGISGVPSCASSAALAAQAGIPLATLDGVPKVDFAFTDADLVQEGTLFGVVGRRPAVPGCDSILNEKAIASAAEKFAFLVREKQFVEKLTGAIPILIRSEEWLDIAEEIDDTFLGEAEVWRRPATGTAGPMGGDFPLVTPEGHFIVDLIFNEPIEDASELASLLESIPGVVAHGLFLDQADTAAVAGAKEVFIRTSRFRQAFITSPER